MAQHEQRGTRGPGDRHGPGLTREIAQRHGRGTREGANAIRQASTKSTAHRARDDEAGGVTAVEQASAPRARPRSPQSTVISLTHIPTNRSATPDPSRARSSSRTASASWPMARASNATRLAHQPRQARHEVGPEVAPHGVAAQRQRQARLLASTTRPGPAPSRRPWPAVGELALVDDEAERRRAPRAPRRGCGRRAPRASATAGANSLSARKAEVSVAGHGDAAASRLAPDRAPRARRAAGRSRRRCCRRTA